MRGGFDAFLVEKAAPARAFARRRGDRACERAPARKRGAALTHILERIVQRLETIERELVRAHEGLCGCDKPGEENYCIAHPRRLYRLIGVGELSESDRRNVERLLQVDRGSEPPGVYT